MTISRFRWWHVPVAIAAAAAVVALLQPELFTVLRSRGRASAALVNHPVEGRFRAVGEELGSWTLTPDGCLDGSERGFQGIAFVFGAGNPVEEIRVDTARSGDNVVEVRMANSAGTVKRAREGQCKNIGGDLTRSNVVYNHRPMVRLKGRVEVDCPPLGLSFEARFDGCLPEVP